MTENDLQGTCGLKFEVKEEELAQPKCMNRTIQYIKAIIQVEALNRLMFRTYARWKSCRGCWPVANKYLALLQVDNCGFLI